MRLRTRGSAATLLLAGLALAACAPASCRGDFSVSGAFGPFGEGGAVVGQSITFGSSGNASIYQVDGFITIAGQDLSNGNGLGPAAQLSNGPATSALLSSFASAVSQHELTLTYRFANVSMAAINGFQFLSFVDADVSATGLSDYSTTAGTLGPGFPGSPRPSSYQSGDPTNGTLFTNLSAGALNNTTSFGSPSQVGDVAFGLGFNVATIGVNQAATFTVVLSDDGSTIGNGFALTQHATDSSDTLTVSGSASVVSVPEPSAFALIGLGLGLAAASRSRRAQRSSQETR